MPYGPADPVTGTYRYLYRQTVTNSVTKSVDDGNRYADGLHGLGADWRRCAGLRHDLHPDDDK